MVPTLGGFLPGRVCPTPPFLEGSGKKEGNKGGDWAFEADLQDSAENAAPGGSKPAHALQATGTQAEELAQAVQAPH